MCNFFGKADNKMFNFWRSILWTFWLKFAALITHRMKCSGSLELSGRMHFMWKILWWNSITSRDELSIQRCHICHILAFVTRDTGTFQKKNYSIFREIFLIFSKKKYYTFKIFSNPPIPKISLPAALHKQYTNHPALFKVVFGRKFRQKNVAECLFRLILQDTIFL